MSPSGRAVLLYDADCGFCRWSLAKLLAWDRHRQLRPVALQASEASRLLAGMDEERRMAAWHLVGEDEGRVSGGMACPSVLRLLPGGSAPAAVLARFPGVLERGYGWVAEHRGALGKPITRAAVQRAEARIAARAG